MTNRSIYIQPTPKQSSTLSERIITYILPVAIND